MEWVQNVLQIDSETGLRSAVPLPPEEPTAGSESYSYSDLREHVSRAVLLSDGGTFLTRRKAIRADDDDPHLAFDRAFLRQASRGAADESLPAIHGVDLFCGCGGLSLGAKYNQINHAALEPMTASTLAG
jgi:hypothetical protein